VSDLPHPFQDREFYRRIKPILDDLFAPTTTLHGFAG
jgi:hypothetical protein